MMPPASPPPPKADWTDLRTRTLSGVFMAGLGLVAVVAGGVWFQMLAVFVAAVMVWELWTMIAPERPVPAVMLAAAVASILSGAFIGDGPHILVFLLLSPTIGTLLQRRERAVFAVFATAIVVSAWGLVELRLSYGMIALIWLISVVVTVDVHGVFRRKDAGWAEVLAEGQPKENMVWHRCWLGGGGGGRDPFCGGDPRAVVFDLGLGPRGFGRADGGYCRISP